MSNAKHPMQLSKVLRKQVCLPEFIQQGFHPFQVRPCTLWDEPHPPCRNPNDAQQHLKG
jgi:hypothetical protein